MITHILKTQRRTKIVYKEIPLIFGISGLARCGKDTFAKYLSLKLKKHQ
jgi:uridine kinase